MYVIRFVMVGGSNLPKNRTKIYFLNDSGLNTKDIFAGLVGAVIQCFLLLCNIFTGLPQK